MKHLIMVAVIATACTSTHEALKNFFHASEFVCHNLPAIEAVSISVVPSDAGSDASDGE